MRVALKERDLRRTSTANGKSRAKLTRLTNQAQLISAELDTLFLEMEAAEARGLKKLATIRGTAAQVRLLDASLLEELAILLEKFTAPRTPQNIESILREMLRLIAKMIWKLFILQGLPPPAIDPRLLESAPPRRSRARG